MAPSSPRLLAGLVFVAAFAPEAGEILGQVTPTSKDAILGTALVPHQYPIANGGTATEFVVDPVKFHDVFAADLQADQAAVLAATQRPVADAAFSDVMGTPAWKDLPSWAVVATSDKAAGTDLVRSMAERAGAARSGRDPMATTLAPAFADTRQIDAGVLNVGYVDAGPRDGPAVVLLHGWPYDIHSYAEVTPLLAAAGYRVIVPHLRGFGTTHFLSKETRNGEQAALALDVTSLMDAL